jgi:hypothetical protein
MPEPLKPAVFQVLLSLAAGDKHGYAVLKDVEEESGGEVKLSTGTLYAVFKRLLAEGPWRWQKPNEWKNFWRRPAEPN